MADTDTDKDETTTDDTASNAEVEKWKALARKHEARAKENAGAAQRLAEIEEQGKSESERLAERIASAERRAEDAERKALRYEVAAAKGVPSKLMRFLQGNTEEELTASADELLEAVSGKTQSDTDDKDNGSDDADAPDKGAPSGRPQERLQAGAANDADPDETDPAKLAAQIPRL